MFNLDLIEEDWKNNSFRLSEEDVIEIYRSEGATLCQYQEEMDKYRKQTNSCILDLSSESRLLRVIFGEDKEVYEQGNRLIDETPRPQKKHLSKENQMKVVEGCLYLVFDETRKWYNFFQEKLSMEKIYYICLEALINSVKYMVHCGHPVFRFYVSKSIEQNIINYVSRFMHITYREAKENIDDYFLGIICEEAYDGSKKHFKFDLKEEPEKPSKIYYRLKNQSYYVEYIEKISSSKFMEDYKAALENLDEDAKIVMQLSFDNNGYRGLTSSEIADYLGIDRKKVYNIKRRAIKVLRKDINLNRYILKE